MKRWNWTMGMGKTMRRKRRWPRRRGAIQGGKKEKAPIPPSGGERSKTPTPPEIPECTFTFTLTEIDGLITRKVEATLIKQGTSRDQEKGALPKVPAPWKWSDMEAKRPMRKFLEEVEVWFDAMDIKGTRRVQTFPTFTTTKTSKYD
jgi:hypothetical protein